MKEMGKYENALDQASVMHRAGNKDVKQILEQIFPELKESGDERIRREIIGFIRNAYWTSNRKRFNELVAWLEKQGEPIEVNPTEFDTRLQALIGKFCSLPKEKLIESLSFWMNVVQNDGTYKDEEKQGEQKPSWSEEETIRKALLNYFNEANKTDENPIPGIQTDKVIKWLEKQDLNYTFEIKKGHWYKCVCDYMLNNSDLMFKNDRLYYCRSDWRLGGEIDERNVKDIGVNGYKSFFRPATNQEIKDWLEKKGEQKSVDKIEPEFHEGDWIVQENVGVFKVIEICESCYEVINSEDNHYSISFDKERMCHLWDITKDAKDGDVLFVKPTENLGKQLIIFGGINSDSRIKYYCRFLNNKFSIGGGLMGYDHKYFLLATKEQRDTFFAKMRDAGYTFDFEKKKLKEIEQPSAWSEEDEYLLGETIQHLEELIRIEKVKHCGIDVQYYQRDIDWLKSLKDRVLPQPKQEWSEEDNKRLSELSSILEIGGNFALSDWLKSLRPQNTWKPSDEQLNALYNAAVYVDKSMFPYPKGTLMKLYKQLAKLRKE